MIGLVTLLLTTSLLSRNIFVDNRYKGFSFIVCLTIVTLTLIATFRPHTAGLHQAIVSIY